MVAFDLEYQRGGSKFREAMSFLVRDMGVRLVAFPGRSYAGAALSYDALAGYAESDVAFVSFDTDRPYQRLNPLSKMHAFPFIGTDIYAIRTPRFVPGAAEAGGSSGAGSGGAESALDSVRFFEPSSLTIRPSAERVGDPAALLDEMGERGNAQLRGMLEEYESARDNPDKAAALSSLSRVHELVSSTAEFGNFRDWIKKGETAEYVKEKPRLEATLADLEQQRKGR